MLSLQAVCLVVLLVLAQAGLGVEALIFRDFTSEATFGLSHSLTAPGDADSTYHTGCGNGHMRFALYWNGDLQDAFSMAPPAGLTIAAKSSPAFCGHEIGSTVTFTSRTVNQCNYTASWTSPVNGVLGITYNTGNSPSQASQLISIPFDNDCPL
jgi:hypothetical protein